MGTMVRGVGLQIKYTLGAYQYNMCIVYAATVHLHLVDTTDVHYRYKTSLLTAFHSSNGCLKKKNKLSLDIASVTIHVVIIAIKCRSPSTCNTIMSTVFQTMTVNYEGYIQCHVDIS